MISQYFIRVQTDTNQEPKACRRLTPAICISSTDRHGRQFWVVAAERGDAGRFIVHSDERLALRLSGELGSPYNPAELQSTKGIVSRWGHQTFCTDHTREDAGQGSLARELVPGFIAIGPWCEGDAPLKQTA